MLSIHKWKIIGLSFCVMLGASLAHADVGRPKIYAALDYFLSSNAEKSLDPAEIDFNDQINEFGDPAEDSKKSSSGLGRGSVCCFRCQGSTNIGLAEIWDTYRVPAPN